MICIYVMLRKVNDIYVTEVITFPRSGHTWLSRILKYYFLNNLNYCEFHTDPSNSIDLNVNTNLQKNHDFDLKTEIKSDRKYLIQIRKKYECLNSLYRLDSLNIDRNMNKHDEDQMTRTNFIETYGISYFDFLNEKGKYYDNFLSKWVFVNIDNSKLVIYEKLKNDTFKESKSIIQFLCDNQVDDEKLIKVIEYSNKPHTSGFDYENILITS